MSCKHYLNKIYEGRINVNVQEKLNSLSCDDIAPKVKKKKRPAYYIFSTVRIVLFLVCLAVFVFSLKSIFENFEDYKIGDEIYGNIQLEFDNMGADGLTSPIYSADKTIPLSKFDDMLISDGVAPPIVSNEDMEEFLKVRNKLEILRKDYPDLYGWLNVKGTSINYPVMQGTDNSFYVDHTPDGSKNSAGSIFADFRCKNPAEKTQNLVLYGHNIRSWGTMFNGITNFFNKNYFESHRTIELWTFDGIYEYTIISIYETNIYDDYTTISFGGGSITSFIRQTIEQSANSAGEVEYNAASKLITLSTCSNSLDSDNRYALVGILTKSITAA